MIERLKGLVKQFSKFALIGGLNTLIDISVLNVLIFITGITSGYGIFIITSLAFIVANINSYFLNKNWTFKEATRNTHFTQKKDTVKFGEFLTVSIIGLVINAVIVYVITTYIPVFFNNLSLIRLLSSTNIALDTLWVNAAKIIAIAFSLVWNFIGYKLFVFKK